MTSMLLLFVAAAQPAAEVEQPPPAGFARLVEANADIAAGRRDRDVARLMRGICLRAAINTGEAHIVEGRLVPSAQPEALHAALRDAQRLARGDADLTRRLSEALTTADVPLIARQLCGAPGVRGTPSVYEVTHVLSGRAAVSVRFHATTNVLLRAEVYGDPEDRVGLVLVDESRDGRIVCRRPPQRSDANCSDTPPHSAAGRRAYRLDIVNGAPYRTRVRLYIN